MLSVRCDTSTLIQGLRLASGLAICSGIITIMEDIGATMDAIIEKSAPFQFAGLRISKLGEPL